MNDQPIARVRTVYIVLGANVLLFLVLLVTLGYVQTLRGQVQETTAQSRNACARGNLIRAQVNYNSSVTQSFLAQAATTRDQTAIENDKAGEDELARINRDAAKAYRGLSQGFVPLPIVSCETIYP